MNKIIRLGFTALIMSLFLVPSLLPVHATNKNPFNLAQNQVTEVKNSAGVEGDATLPETIGSLINIALSFVGILLLVYILYAGFKWMTAGGDTKGVEAAQTMIKNAVIGLLIVIASFAISNYVLDSLIRVTQGQ